MRPVLKLALVLLVLALAPFGYFVWKGLNVFNAASNISREKALVMAIQTACMAYVVEYNRLPPSSDNQRFTAALLGDNSRFIAFISLSDDEINDKKEMIDPWSTPLKMTFLDNGTLQVTSAGPDKIFGTMDDIVINTLLSAQNH
jgi:hypothetical protein